MTTYPNRPVAAAFRDADSVRRGPLPAEVSMEPVVSGASCAREDVLLDEAGRFLVRHLESPDATAHLRRLQHSRRVMDATGDLMSDDPYAAVTPAPSLTVHSDDFELGGEMPSACGGVTAWVDAQP
jgi:hypothetical protein